MLTFDIERHVSLETVGLARKRWTFILLSGLGNTRLSLDFYRHEVRETRRHKWRMIHGWSRHGGLHGGGYGHRMSYSLKPGDVPVPPDVLKAAKHRLINIIEMEYPGQPDAAP